MTSTPAVLWRAFFVTAVLAWARPAGGAPPISVPPPLSQTGSAEEGRAALEQLRRQGIAGDYYLEFQLRVMPRRGDERLLTGRLWGSRGSSGPLTRVSIVTDDAGAERRLLVVNGRHPAAWMSDAGKPAQPLTPDQLFAPLVPGAELTAFDLEMPYIYWDDFAYEGMVRTRGRPSHVLMLRPPASFAKQHAGLRGVRVHLDTQFNALMQTELIRADGAVIKTMSLLDLKKVGEQWIPKSFDLKDEASRNKTRLIVTAAALNQDFSRVVFEAEQLNSPLARPTAGLEQIEP